MRSLLTMLKTEVAEPPWKKPKAEDVKEEGEADPLAEEAEGSGREAWAPVGRKGGSASSSDDGRSRWAQSSIASRMRRHTTRQNKQMTFSLATTLVREKSADELKHLQQSEEAQLLKQATLDFFWQRHDALYYDAL